MAFRRTIHTGIGLDANAWGNPNDPKPVNYGSRISSRTSDDAITWGNIDLGLDIAERGSVVDLQIGSRARYIVAEVVPSPGTPFIRAWNRTNTNTYTQIANIAPLGGYQILSSSLSPNDQWLAVGSYSPLTPLNNANTRVDIYSVSNVGFTLANTITGNTGVRLGFNTLEWTANSDALLTGWGARVHDWNGANLTLRSNAIYPAFTGNIRSASFSDNGQYLAVAQANPGNVKIFNTSVTPWTPISVEYNGIIDLTVAGLPIKLVGEITAEEQLPDPALYPFLVINSTVVFQGFVLRGDPNVYYYRTFGSDWESLAGFDSFNTKSPVFNAHPDISGDVAWIDNSGLAIRISGNTALAGNVLSRLEVYNWDSDTSTLTWNYQNYAWPGTGEPNFLHVDPDDSTVYLSGTRNLVSPFGGLVQVLEPTTVAWNSEHYYTTTANIDIIDANLSNVSVSRTVSFSSTIIPGQIDIETRATVNAGSRHPNVVPEVETYWQDVYCFDRYMAFEYQGQAALVSIADTERVVDPDYIDEDYFFFELTTGSKVRSSTADLNVNTSVSADSVKLVRSQADLASEATLQSQAARTRFGQAQLLAVADQDSTAVITASARSAMSAQTQVFCDATVGIITRAQAVLTATAQLQVTTDKLVRSDVEIESTSTVAVQAGTRKEAAADLLSENFAAVTVNATRNFIADLSATTSMSVTASYSVTGRAGIASESTLAALGFVPVIQRGESDIVAESDMSVTATRVQVSMADLQATADLVVDATFQAFADAHLQITASLTALATVLEFKPELTLQVPEQTRLYPVLAELRGIRVPEETRLNSILPEVRGISVPQETRQEKVI